MGVDRAHRFGGSRSRNAACEEICNGTVTRSRSFPHPNLSPQAGESLLTRHVGAAERFRVRPWASRAGILPAGLSRYAFSPQLGCWKRNGSCRAVRATSSFAWSGDRHGPCMRSSARSIPARVCARNSEAHCLRSLARSQPAIAWRTSSIELGCMLKLVSPSARSSAA
jgi:hypothetical protein